MHVRSLALIVGLLLGGALPVGAQEPAPPPAQEKAPPARDVRQAPPVAFTGQPVNVQVEVTITDRSGNGQPDTKVVSMLVGDGAWGRIRAATAARASEKSSAAGVELNVDGRPAIVEGQTIRLELTLEYVPLKPMELPLQLQPTRLHESLVVFLRDGRPMTVSQAADPLTDRQITVEVKATILK